MSDSIKLSSDSQHPTLHYRFDWDRPWLPRLARLLLKEWAADQSTPRGDLSETVVIVPGKRAGRRLLELLALEAAEESQLLIPPRIVTLREAVALLLPLENEPLSEAGTLTSRLAWREALRKLALSQLVKIQQIPKTSSREGAAQHLVSLAESLSAELGSVGLDCSMVAARIAALAPESAEREEPRWEALAELQDCYRAVLQAWGYSDAGDVLREHLTHGTFKNSWRVMAVGLIDYSPLYTPFFEKVNPAMVVITPEEHVLGFGEQGELITSYWLDHPAVVDDGQIIPCARSDDQAKEVVRLVGAVEEASSHLTIAVPDVITLPFLRDPLAEAGVKTRWAGGIPFRGGRLYQLLEAVAAFVDRKHPHAPSVQAVGALVRHPDINRTCPDAEEFLKKLDLLEREHLPAFLEEESLALFQKNEALISFLAHLEEIVGISSQPEPLATGVAQLRAFLRRLLGEQVVRSSDPQGHYLLGCVEKLLPLLEESEQLGFFRNSTDAANCYVAPVLAPSSTSGTLSRCAPSTPCTSSASASLERSLLKNNFSIRPAEWIRLLLKVLDQEMIPEPEELGSMECVGWLELAADDAPQAIITSCHEGMLPRSQPKNPLLPEGLRKRLGLSESKDLLARDHYLLQLIMASRDVKIIAPRYNGRGEPVRPSRLLMLGCSPETLPQRVLQLIQRSSSKEEEALVLQQVSQFQARPVGKETVDHVTVTALRTYLQSPRLFYLQHVLKLQEIPEAPLEMHAGHFGTLIHAVLGAFGVDEKIAASTDAAEMALWLRKKLTKIAQRHFAPLSFPVTLQLEEAAHALEGFATAQAAHRHEGWKIIAAENMLQGHSRPLEEKIILRDGRSMILQGRIDRVDWNSEQKRWLLIDYKTSSHQEWRSATPNKEHYQKRGEEIVWKDLQLPLYLKLVRQWEVVKRSGLPLPDLDNTDLCYFQLPVESEKAGLSEPFSNAMILPAWQEAKRLIEEILNSNFEEIGEVDAARHPTLAALCGIASLSTSKQTEE